MAILVDDFPARDGRAARSLMVGAVDSDVQVCEQLLFEVETFGFEGRRVQDVGDEFDFRRADDFPGAFGDLFGAFERFALFFRQSGCIGA